KQAGRVALLLDTGVPSPGKAFYTSQATSGSRARGCSILGAWAGPNISRSWEVREDACRDFSGRPAVSRWPGTCHGEPLTSALWGEIPVQLPSVPSSDPASLSECFIPSPCVLSLWYIVTVIVAFQVLYALYYLF
uniref:Uncharacterized protein n=1 Tax=Mustela putorius furo TaxID=9669 RepID=M3XR91_MUSPF